MLDLRLSWCSHVTFISLCSSEKSCIVQHPWQTLNHHASLRMCQTPMANTQSPCISADVPNLVHCVRRAKWQHQRRALIGAKLVRANFPLMKVCFLFWHLALVHYIGHDVFRYLQIAFAYSIEKVNT